MQKFSADSRSANTFSYEGFYEQQHLQNVPYRLLYFVFIEVNFEK